MDSLTPTNVYLEQQTESETDRPRLLINYRLPESDVPRGIDAEHARAQGKVTFSRRVFVQHAVAGQEVYRANGIIPAVTDAARIKIEARAELIGVDSERIVFVENVEHV